MNFAIFLSSMLFTFFIIITKKTLSTKAKIFIVCYSLWWFITSFIGFFCFNNLYEYNFTSLIIVVLSIISFVIGFIYTYKNTDVSENLKVNRNKPSIIITGLLIILIIVLFYYFLRYRTLLNDYGISESRNIKFTIGMLFETQLEAYIYNNILYPIILFFIAYIPIGISKYKFKSINTYLTLIMIVLYSLVGNGRLIYFESFFIICMVSLLIIKNPLDFIKNNLKYIFLSISLIFIIMLLLSASRFGINELSRIPYLVYHSVDQFFQYVGYPFRAFDKFIEYNCSQTIYDIIPHTFGRTTLSGLDVLILKPLTWIGLDVVNINSIFGNLIQEGISIGYRINMNAYFTSLCNYYVDFGYIGCVVIPGVLGMIIAKGMYLAEKTNNQYIYMLVGSNMAFFCLGSIRWVYTYTPYWVLLFIIVSVYFYFRTKTRKEDNNL